MGWKQGHPLISPNRLAFSNSKRLWNAPWTANLQPLENMSLLRAFIAVELPLEIRQAVCTATSRLQKEIGALIRWVPIENMHLTLKFLGDVSPPNVEML